MARNLISLAQQNAVEAMQDSIRIKQKIIEQGLFNNLITMAEIIAEAIINGNKLLICGNGGSAADAQHLAAELLIRLRPNKNRKSLPAISLAQDTSTITACANDYGYEVLFERLLQSLGSPGDVLLGITTSGNSENVLRALKYAQNCNIRSFGFLGCGGEAIKYCDEAFVVPSEATARIQESHIMAGHIMMESIEDILMSKGYIEIS